MHFILQGRFKIRILNEPGYAGDEEVLNRKIQIKLHLSRNPRIAFSDLPKNVSNPIYLESYDKCFRSPLIRRIANLGQKGWPAEIDHRVGQLRRDNLPAQLVAFDFRKMSLPHLDWKIA